MVSALDAKRADGVVFFRVAVTRRTRGWIQRDAVVAPAVAHDDERLFRLIEASKDFDRIARAAIFLEMFPRSRLRPNVLLLQGEAAEAEAVSISRAAERRLDVQEMKAGGAPLHSYYLNFNGLDRYRRQGVAFNFDATTKTFHYDGASWRELVRRFPRSPQAVEARQRLESLRASTRR
jgi:hypothetical protein